jgi:RND family efflux transporter MFP subunit
MPAATRHLVGMSETTSRTLEALQSLQQERSAAPRRGGRWPRLLPSLLGLLLLVAIVLWWSSTQVPSVTTARAVRQSAAAEQEITTANGYVTARVRASVASKTQGRLVAVHVREGDVVAAGHELAEVEHAEEDAQVREAEAQWLAAQAELRTLAAEVTVADAAVKTAEATERQHAAALAEARTVLQMRNNQLRRTEDLFAQKIATDKQMDDAREAVAVSQSRLEVQETTLAASGRAVEQSRAEAAASRTRVEGARSRATAAEAVLQQAKARREQALIKAPFAGIVLRRDAEPGEVVSPANTGGSGSKTAVVTMADFKSLEVEVDVYERDIGRVRQEGPCKVVLDAYPDAPQRGRVRLLKPTADRTRATIQVFVSFESVPETARPEMGARVVFFEPGADVLAPNVVLVPAAALTERGGQRGVFTLVGKNVRFVKVEVGATRGEQVVVESGLLGGENVVLSPVAGLQDGAQVSGGG